MGLYVIFSFIDYAVFWLVKFAIKLIILIANYDFFGPEIVKDVTSKVYIILGIVMLFKIVISCIQFMVNPDQFDDKDKGMGGLLKKTVICVGLLVLIDPIFQFAQDVQLSVVSSIPGIIMGQNGNSYDLRNGSASEKLEKLGDDVAITTLSAFINIKPTAKNQEMKIKDNLDSFVANITEECDSSFWKLLDPTSCKYDYRFFVSTAAGVFLLYVLISMTLDIGIRTIKLGLLRILAPIPISSYIMSKDKLSKFFKIAMNVYLDLFVRLFVVFFVVFFLQEVILKIVQPTSLTSALKGYTPTVIETAFLKITIIGALFAFAKNAPKFICDVLGIDGGGFGDMKDMFKPIWQRNGALAAGAGIFTAGASNVANRIAAGKTAGEKLRNAFKARTWGSGIAGAVSAGIHGTISAAQGKSGREVMNDGHRRAINARVSRDIAKMKGTSGIGAAFERAAVRTRDFAGIVTPVSLMQAQQKAMEGVASSEKAEIGRTNILLQKNMANIDANHGYIARGLDKLANEYIAGRGATITTDAAGVVHVSGIGDSGAQQLIEDIKNKRMVSLAKVLSFSNYTGDNAALKELSTLLGSDKDYLSNIHKDATQQAYNGGVYSMEVDSSGNQKTFGKLDASNTAEFDVQLQGYHNTLVGNFVNDADSLGVLMDKLKAKHAQNPGETASAYLDRIYRHHTRDFESAMDDAVTQISGAITTNEKARRETVIRDDIKRRAENNKKSS